MWNKASILLNEFYNNSYNDEKFVISIIRKMCQDYKSDFPSETRNIINYHGQFGINSIKKTFTFSETILPLDQYLKRITNYKKSDNLTSKAEDVGLLGYYFFILSHELLKDYYTRIWRVNDFQKIRKSFLKSRALKFPFD